MGEEGIMKHSQQKLKLLYLAKYLTENSDEDNPKSVKDMIDFLSEQGITAERKSIYDDVECLTLAGLDICKVKNKTSGYYVATRDFELPELKLLVDSVQSSKFITHKKSLELISKIEKLTSVSNAGKLHRQVFVTNRVKTLNEHIYYNVDKIYDAISADRMITFKYFDYNIKKEKVYRKDGGDYTESPISLTWDDENYYMITYKEKYNSFAHYRVDKMENIKLTDTPRTMPENDFDLSLYTKSVFSMFGGEETKVTLEFENSLVGVVFDRFGIDIPILKTDDRHFSCTVNVAVSPHFLSWIMGFGAKAKIVSPEEVVETQKALLKEIQKNYN